MNTRAFVLVLCLAAAAPGTTAEAGEAFELLTREEKIVYALGLTLSQNLRDFRLSERELEALHAGLVDGTRGEKPKVAQHVWRRRVEPFKQERMREAREQERADAARFIEVALQQPGAVQKTSGLIYTELEAGSGARPDPAQRVRVDYHGTLPDGSVFDSTRGREPAVFGLSEVIACWTEALALMREGGVSRIVCPSQIAYGEQGFGPMIAPGQALAFEVELVEVLD